MKMKYHRLIINKNIKSKIKLVGIMFLSIILIYLLRGKLLSFGKSISSEVKHQVLFESYQNAFIVSSPCIHYVDKYINRNSSYVSNHFASQFSINKYMEDQPVLYAKGLSKIYYLDSEITSVLGNDMEPIENQFDKSNGIGSFSKRFLMSNGTDFTREDDMEGQEYTDSTVENNNLAGETTEAEEKNGVRRFNESEGMETEDRETNTPELEIGVISGKITPSADATVTNQQNSTSLTTLSGNVFTMDMLKDKKFLLNNFYILNTGLNVDESLFDSEVLLNKDMTMKQRNDKPQILIYHTHSLEQYKDSREGIVSDSVVGVGSYLAEILTEEYGYQVIHDTTSYDIVNGVHDRNKAYDVARKGLQKNLEKYPSIEVVIDLHRDGNKPRTTTINGKSTARIMMFNGMSRNQKGPIEYLYNPYIQDNLSFSLQLQLKSLELYPGLFYKNYLHFYRYNMDIRAKSVLIELGTENNTLQEAKNAMSPFAEVLDSVLKGE